MLSPQWNIFFKNRSTSSKVIGKEIDCWSAKAPEHRPVERQRTRVNSWNTMYGGLGGQELLKDHHGIDNNRHHWSWLRDRQVSKWCIFSARCNIYISRLCNDVRLSIRLSVTQVHWRIIANLGFKFRSQFTAHCGRGACEREGRDHRREEWRDHLALVTARPSRHHL